MAETTQDKREEGEKKLEEELNLAQRRAINNAYASLQGSQTAQTFAAFTFEEALDAQIERIKGKDTDLHPNQLKRVANIKGQLDEAVAALKDIPPERFMEVNVPNVVNTSPNDDEFWDDWWG